ncbi:LysE/ArgO family amino acid transporter [Massilia sp. W12]|uniref:LysE/ArgO family amino acid transporter n=1 Tax=Massilia sp. W12 TaxID=3126507 RepID=UPI0030D5B007
MLSNISFWQGLGLGSGLIMAIGAQNAHVIKTGLLGRHVGVTVLVCILTDALLISAGVGGLGAMLQHAPLLMAAAKWGGVAFLLWYGVRSLRAAFSAHHLDAASGPAVQSARQALFSVLALSWLNPHVYLDTVVLLGAVGSDAPDRFSFALGAICASTVWFCAIGFGARKLAPWFAKPVAWKWIDGASGGVMFSLAGALAFGA